MIKSFQGDAGWGHWQQEVHTPPILSEGGRESEDRTIK